MNSIHCPTPFTTRGQAVILGVFLLLGFSLITSASLVHFAQTEIKNTRLMLSAIQAHAAAESGVEDVALRIINNLEVDATETLTVRGKTVTTTLEDSGDTREVLGDTTVAGAERRVELILTEGSIGTDFVYGLQVGYAGLEMENNSEVQGSVYSNGSIIAAENTTITGDAWVAAGTASVADQSQDSQTDTLNIRDATARRDAAQSFTPSITADIGRIELFIRKVGNPSNATIEIVPDNNGVPANSGSLADGTLRSTNVTGSFGWVSVALDADQALVASTTYWIVIDNGSSSASNYYILGSGTDASYADGTFLYSSSWSADPPAWTVPGAGARDGTFRVYMGDITTVLTNITVGGDAHANTIDDSDIAGDAYYQTISGSTVGGTSYPGSADPPALNLPLSDAQLDEIKAWGEDGGSCGPPTCDASGNYLLAGSSASLGPIRIPGNMTIDIYATLTVNGTIYVQGDLYLQNNCIIQLAPSYRERSGIIIADGIVNIENGCVISGSGDPDSYLMIITTSEQIDDPPALNLENNATGAIFYAAKGSAHLENNVNVHEVVGQRIELENNAILIYDSGLAHVDFSSGPTGGYRIDRWSEVE